MALVQKRNKRHKSQVKSFSLANFLFINFTNKKQMQNYSSGDRKNEATGIRKEKLGTSHQ